MNVDDLLAQARKIWGKQPAILEKIAVALGVVYGDLCRQARNLQEGKDVDEAELQKELGNVILSTIRWCAELGYDPKACIELAKTAQASYAGKRSLQR